MSEKFEKCPNCDAELSGFLSNSIVEDEVIKGINEKIKKIKDEPELRADDLEEKEAYCTGCLDDVKQQSENLIQIWLGWKKTVLGTNQIQNVLHAEL